MNQNEPSFALFMRDSHFFSLTALSGIGCVALEESPQLGRVTVGRYDEVAHFMKAGTRAAPDGNEDKSCHLHRECSSHTDHSKMRACTSPISC